MRRLHVLAVRVVQEVEGLGHHRIGEDELPSLGDLPLKSGVADHADAVGARQENRAFEKPGLLDPVDAGHVAVAVLVEGGGHDEVPVALGTREDRRDPGANRTLAGNELALALDDGGMAHRHAGHVGDGVPGPRRVGEGNAQIAGSRAIRDAHGPAWIPLDGEAGPELAHPPLALELGEGAVQLAYDLVAAAGQHEGVALVGHGLREHAQPAVRRAGRPHRRVLVEDEGVDPAAFEGGHALLPLAQGDSLDVRECLKRARRGSGAGGADTPAAELREGLWLAGGGANERSLAGLEVGRREQILPLALRSDARRGRDHVVLSRRETAQELVVRAHHHDGFEAGSLRHETSQRQLEAGGHAGVILVVKGREGGVGRDPKHRPSRPPAKPRPPPRPGPNR